MRAPASTPVKIAVEIGGWDAPLGPLADGLSRGVSQLGLEILLFGPKEEFEAEPRLNIPGVEFSEARRGEFLCGGPSDAWLDQADSALSRAGEAVAARRAQAVVFTTEPACAAAALAVHLKRAPGVLRPALAAFIPHARGRSLLLDAGSQIDCKPWHILQFAVMGSLYARHALKIASPKVALFSGAGAAGQTAWAKEILPLMKFAGVDFSGPAGGEDLVEGTADVFVCDGSLGDAAARLHRGLSRAAFEMLESGLQSSPFRKVGGALISGALKGAKSAFLGAASGGAPLLGLGGPAAALLGARTAETVFDALGCAAGFAASDVREAIHNGLAGMKADMESVQADG